MCVCVYFHSNLVWSELAGYPVAVASYACVYKHSNEQCSRLAAWRVSQSSIQRRSPWYVVSRVFWLVAVHCHQGLVVHLQHLWHSCERIHVCDEWPFWEVDPLQNLIQTELLLCGMHTTTVARRCSILVQMDSVFRLTHVTRLLTSGLFVSKKMTY